ncbi:MAG TPA: LacI family DNA-binding transcriptional regulator [Mobilitalea sp.]|nr:LacI family DNA-binding transcriptional regulator [Mobilitalea sp.]
MEKKLTLDDIARELGVSKTTVSRVISGKGRIGNETKEKVMKYIEEHNYIPNAIARGLAQSKTYNIAVAIHGDYSLVDLPFFQKCIFGISEIASTVNYHTINAIIKGDDISQLESIVENRKVDGVILTRTLMNDKPAEYLKKQDIPFVTIGSSLDDEVVQVDNDHRSACKELTSILLMKGMRRIALIGGDEAHVVTQNRYKGYLDAFEAHDIPVNKEIVYMNVDSSVLSDKIVDNLLRMQVDCIVCMDDLICLYVLNKLKREHIKVPQQMKVASFYDSSLLESNLPSITSLSFDINELGMVTCCTLLDLIDGKEVKKKTMLGYGVVLKESTK